VIYSKHLLEREGQKTLMYESDKSLQNHLTSFLMDKVFLEDDDGRVYLSCPLKLWILCCFGLKI